MRQFLTSTITLLLFSITLTACGGGGGGGGGGGADGGGGGTPTPTPTPSITVDSFDELATASANGTDRTIEFPSLGVAASLTVDLSRPADNEFDSWFHDTQPGDITVNQLTVDETTVTNPKLTVSYSNELLSHAAVKFGDKSYELDADGESTKILLDGAIKQEDSFVLGYMEVSLGQDFGFDSKYLCACYL